MTGQQNSSPWGEKTKFFHQLSPDKVLDAVESYGIRTTGKVLTLNSLENRVYDVELQHQEDFGPGFSQNSLILKFYRPGRWSLRQIEEEHQFLEELHLHEIPVIAPLRQNGKSLFVDEQTQLHFSLFPKVLGRLKDELNNTEIEQIGRLIGRIHNIGKISSFTSRPHLDLETFVDKNEQALRDLKLVDHPSFEHYLNLLPQLKKILQTPYQNLSFQRLHGDFHRGNIVWTDHGPVAVDFDDCLMGPKEQDLWLLFPGNDHYAQKDRELFLSSYQEMTRSYEFREKLIEPLRAIRTVNFNAWLSKRWEDHSFKRVFPHFADAQYWDQELIELRNQMARLQEW